MLSLRKEGSFENDTTLTLLNFQLSKPGPLKLFGLCSPPSSLPVKQEEKQAGHKSDLIDP